MPGWFFFIDLLFCFNTAFYTKGVIIYNWRDIFINYLKGNFALDFIVIFPFMISLYLKIEYVDAILFLRSHKIRANLKRFE